MPASHRRLIRLAAGLLLTAAGPGLLVAQTRSEPLLDGFRQAHGAAWELERDAASGRPRRLFGGSTAWAGSADLRHFSPLQRGERFRARARGFLEENATLLGLEPADLRFATAGGASSTDGTLDVLHFDHAPKGVRVLGGRVSFVVAHGRLVHVHAVGTGRVRADEVPALGEEEAQRRAVAAVPGTGAGRAELVFRPEPGGHRLAWRCELESAGTRPRRPVVLIDAEDGSVLSVQDEARSACDPLPAGGLDRRVVGGVRATRADDPERAELLPFAGVAGTSAGADGFFAAPPPPYAGTLDGPVARVSCSSCNNPRAISAPPASGGDVDFGSGGLDALGNGTSTPADRSSFFHVEGAHRLVSRWLVLPFLQQPVRVVTNSPLACNAYWDGAALTFFRSSSRCGNTGEIRDVIVHEYGHALDEHDGQPPAGVAVDAATGEAVADILAVLRSRDACIGESFFADPADWPSNDCSGVRDLDEAAPGHARGTLDGTSIAAACPTSSSYRGPLGHEGHCEGELLGQAFWHLVQNLRTGQSQTDGSPLPGGPLGEEAAWQLAEELFFRALPLIASQAPSAVQSIGISAHDAFMLADDEGDGTANGTPHAVALHDAFLHHGLAETPLAPATGTACAPPADPLVTVTELLDAATGLPTVRLDWSDTGAAAYHVLRAAGAGDGYLTAAPPFGPGAGSFVDRAVLPGRSLLYRVVAESAAGCLSPGALPVPAGTGPRVEASLLVIDDSALGDGDGLLSRGETAELLFDLANRGGSAATNLGLTLASADPALAVLDPGPLAYGTVAAGAGAAAPGAFRVAADPAAPRFLTVQLDGEADEGCQRSEWILEIAQPDLLLEGERLDDTAGGDGDGSWQPGEQVELSFLLRDDGLLPALSVTGELFLEPGAPAGVSLVRATAFWPDVVPGAAEWTSPPAFLLSADPGVPPRASVPLRLDLSVGGALHGSHSIELELGGMPAGTLEWSFGPAIDHTVSPLVVQLDDDDGDGLVTECDTPDVLLRTGWGAGATLLALEGDGSGELWRLTDPCFDMASGSQLAAGDIDRDGENEIVVMDRRGITCSISSAGTLEWRSTVVAQASQVAGATNRGAAPQLRDLDGDGRVEVVVGYTVLDGRDGSLIWEKFVNNRGQVLVVDLDLDGSEEILAGVEPQGPIPADSRTWRADGSRHGVIFPDLYWGAAAADLDGDPEPEVVWVDTRTGVNAADPDGRPLFPRWEAAPLTQIIGTYQPCLADFDGDGLAEIGAPVQGRLVVLDGDGSELWSQPTDGDWFGTCSAFDFDGDGRPELVHHDVTRLTVRDGRDGSVRWETPSPMPYDQWGGPTIADVDGDGAAEILIVGGASPFGGMLEVHGSDFWSAARRIWNQQHYSVTHVEQDGSLPAPAPPWWAGASNGFRLQTAACPCGSDSARIDAALTCGTTTACFDGSAPSLSGALDFEWDFGDGSPLEHGRQLCHDYGSPGRRLVVLRVTDAAGCTLETLRSVDIEPPTGLQPVVPELCDGRDACLDVVVTGPAQPAELLWSFDDGSFVSGAQACRSWAAGPARVVLSALDANGCRLEEVLLLDVAARPASVGARLFVSRLGDPRGPNAEAALTWSSDAGAPRPAPESYLLLRGLDPTALARLPGTQGLRTPSHDDATPAAGAADRPQVHFYRVFSELSCGLASLD